jgi:hypothetical protein
MADLVWQWMIPPVIGVCARCREPLLFHTADPVQRAVSMNHATAIEFARHADR